MAVGPMTMREFNEIMRGTVVDRTVVEKPRVAQGFDDLQAAIERVGLQVDRLVERIDPVLRQVSPTPTADSADGCSNDASNMAQTLTRRIAHLDAISRNLATVIDRVEL